MIYILHIETATKVCSVALSENGNLCDVIDLNEDNYTHGEQLTLLIEQLLQKNKLEMNQLQAVSVSSGPGSYTGLRIGVSTAKGICYALGIPLIAVDTLLSLAEVAYETYPGQNIMPMIDARRMEVFSTIYNGEGKELRSLQAEILEADSNREFDPYVCVGDGASKAREIWEHRSLTFAPEIQPSAQGQVKMAFSKWKQQQFEDVAYFEPNYLKEFYSPHARK